ncbi:MAG: B12-binding domain-containing radical SAM protein [Candidatus Micrarchaeota archaeon]|nr:B12-binding domain-containing radical SAM protein [Candidatus Micrarchaeota archaeon]
MTKYVLVSDNTLLYDYHKFPLLDFLPSAPSHAVPRSAYNFLRGSISPATEGHELRLAPYGLRKLEAALLAGGISRGEIAVAHPDHLGRFIKEDTEIIAVHTMDPFGLGPTTMSYYALFGGKSISPYVRVEWDELISRINALRSGKKAKLIVGGPGVWEYTILSDEIARQKIDYLFQGEADDCAALLFRQVVERSIDPNVFSTSYVTYDDTFHRTTRQHTNFLSRGSSIGPYPKLEDIPDIVGPTTKGMTEVMRGCGIGCDFCEVTLRPLRYYEVDKIAREVEVNVRAGFDYAWMHSDEIFAYKHLPQYVPNQEALVELYTKVMQIKGVSRTNPTHGRISIPAAYPELIEKLSAIGRTGRTNWAGIQVGLETGSEKLAKMHMPAKTLPLKIGVDAGWQEIVWKGVYNFNRHFWRPAFTVQVGQSGETDDDNWETVAMINRLSNSSVNGVPFEFTVTPLYNMPLGRIKARNVEVSLNPSMLAVYYASYRHLAKMAYRNAVASSRGNPVMRAGIASMIGMGGYAMMKAVEHIGRKRGLDLERAKSWGVGNRKNIESWAVINAAM